MYARTARASGAWCTRRDAIFVALNDACRPFRRRNASNRAFASFVDVSHSIASTTSFISGSRSARIVRIDTVRSTAPRPRCCARARPSRLACARGVDAVARIVYVLSAGSHRSAIAPRARELAPMSADD
jgi:hypothetical protein